VSGSTGRPGAHAPVAVAGRERRLDVVDRYRAVDERMEDPPFAARKVEVHESFAHFLAQSVFDDAEPVARPFQ
jgi:hypothetical protein